MGDGRYIVGPIADKDTIIKEEGVSPEEMLWRNANIKEVGYIVEEESIQEMLFKGDDRRLAAFFIFVALGMLARWVYLYN